MLNNGLPHLLGILERITGSEVTQAMGEARVVRPLLSRGGNPATTLERMLKEREPMYLKADVSVNTEMYDLQRLISRMKDVITG